MARGDPEGEAANGGFRSGKCAVRARTVSFHFSITGKIMAHHRLAPSSGYGGSNRVEQKAGMGAMLAAKKPPS